MAILNPNPPKAGATTIVNFCVKADMSYCSRKTDYNEQKNCSYYKTNGTHCTHLRFEYHCDSWDAQHRVKENAK